MGLHLRPDLVQPVARQTGTGDHRRGPGGTGRLGEAKGRRVVTGRRPGRRDIVAISLVHGDHVGQFQDALLDPL